jgi:hypothetical protein
MGCNAMKLTSKLVWVSWAVLSGFALNSTAQAQTDANPASTAAWHALQRTVHTGCRVDSDCRVVGVGVRSCGGPQQYLPWSTRATSHKRLKVAVARYNDLRRAQIERDGENSTCALLPVPDAYCAIVEAAPSAAGGQCTLRLATQGER